VSNDNVLKLIQPGAFDDQVTKILRQGARMSVAQAAEAEVADFLANHADLKTEDGRQRVVRHGHLPEREVMTGIGPVAVRQLRVLDREAAAGDPGRIHFSPAILPPYMRRSKSMETLLPILHLKGISTGDFSGALAALLDKDGPGLSPTASSASRTAGSTRTMHGSSAICRRNATCTNGQTASTCKPSFAPRSS
jgi:putative transposase